MGYSPFFLSSVAMFLLIITMELNADDRLMFVLLPLLIYLATGIVGIFILSAKEERRDRSRDA